MNNHWSKGGVTAHVHEDGSLERDGKFGNGLGSELARELVKFLDSWYGDSVPYKVDEFSDGPTVVIGSADLKPDVALGTDGEIYAVPKGSPAVVDIEPKIVKILQQDAEDFGPVPAPSGPEKTPEKSAPAGETTAPKRRPGRPRKTTGGGESGA